MAAASDLSRRTRTADLTGVPRWMFALGAASVVTFALFAVMQILVATDIITLEEPADSAPIVLRFDVPDIEARKPRRPPAQEPLQAPPPAPRIETSSEVPSQTPVYAPATPGVDDAELTGAVDIVLPPPPLEFRVPPAYPQRELSRGVEGTCTVRYDILASGATANIQVMACDSRGFAQASVAAVEGWRHATRNGGDPNAVVRRGRVTKLDFTLEQ